MVNILIVATTSYAGMGPYVSEIVNSFSPNDHVFYFFHDYKDYFFKKNIKKEFCGKSMFVMRPNSAINKLRNLLTGRLGYEQDILRFCKEKEISIVHFINGPGECRLNRQLETIGIKVIGTIHDLHPHEAKKTFYKMVRQHIVINRMMKAMQQLHYLVTNSNHQFEEMKRMFPTRRIFFHDFPTLVTDKIANGKDVPQELLNYQKSYILFFGRIEQYKGVQLLLEAYTGSSYLNERYGLVIAGKGELTLDYGAHDVLLINRYIRDSEIRYLYEHATCVVYPYISATQSGVLSLSFYFGIPTLTSDVPFFKGIIGDNEYGHLFKKGDVQDLKEKLKKLIESDMVTLSEKEKKYYALHYQKDTARSQLLNIYNGLSINKHNGQQEK